MNRTNFFFLGDCMDHHACANSTVRKHFIKLFSLPNGLLGGCWRGVYFTRWQFFDSLAREVVRVWIYFGKSFNDHYFKQSVRSKIKQRDRILHYQYSITNSEYNRRHQHHYQSNGLIHDTIWQYPHHIIGHKIHLFHKKYGYQLPREGRNHFIDQIWL